MEPLSMIATAASLARLATEHGPGLLRSVGGLLGGKAKNTADTIATLTEQVGNAAAGTSPADKADVLSASIQRLPAEHQVELTRILKEAETSARRLAVERDLATLKDKQHQHEQTQATIRQGDQGKDEYVRHTRPAMARQSCWATLGYVLLLEILQAFGRGSGASWELAALLASPALTYLGLRTMDGFAPFSKSSRDKRSAP